MRRNDPPPRVYARQLLPLECGYPLWTPELGTQFAPYRQGGLRIGDVGVLVPGNGSFDVFFNICSSREDPFHRVNGVPDNFTPVQLDELDIGKFPHAENPGQVISTSSVTPVRKTGEPSNYEFSLSSNEGALLILPHGAESYSLLKHQLFNDVAEQNGEQWYNFARQRLGRMIRNDSLYLITGFYKSRSWSVAAFHETTGPATGFPAHFTAGQVSDGDTTAAYTWESMRALHWRVGPLDVPTIPDQTPFISGFKIALRDNILGKKWVEVVVDAPPAEPRPTKFLSGSQGRSVAAKFLKSLVPKGGKGRGATDQGEGPNDASGSRRVTVSHVPEAPRSVHPSDIVNRYLLRKDPNATISITHDSQWIVLLKKGLLKPEDLEDEGRLEKVMSENYRLLSHNGVVSLKSNSDLSIRVVDLSDAARQAWKADKLIDAEEILSKEIVQTIGFNHSMFAGRALLRARLQRWDAALRDAETSIGIQSSVIANIAKGLALFGLEKYGSALQALTLAIRDCDVHDKDFAVLVKSVVLFQAKYHAESMACIADLLEHCPTDFKSTCSSVQAQMLLRLATSAMKNEDYERALQLLERARSLAPFDEIMDQVNTISLISGWEFDNLQYTVYQQHCEGLYIAGKFKEAAIALETMTQDLEENVKARKGNAEWLNKFHHQCLRSLESLGDAALWSQDYPEAIAQYSAALKMEPNTRNGILVKRSKAYLGTRAWDDALNDANEAIISNPLSPRGYEIKYNALRGLERYDEAIGALSNMISNLEQFAEPQTQQLRRRNDNPNTTLALRNSQPLPRLDLNSTVESVLTAIQDADISRATNILDALRATRDEMIRDKDALVTGRQPDASEGADIDGEFPTVDMLPDEQVRGKVTIEERDQKLREELTSLVNPEHDEQVPELMKMVLRLADQAVVKPYRNGELSVQDLLEELQMDNTKQREILETLSDYWKNDGGGEQEKDSDKAPRNFRTLREEISHILADEVKKIMGDVIKLGEERRRMQQELGQLMTLKSKYGPGGEFDPEWIPGHMLPPKAPPPDTPKHPTGRSRKGTKPPVRADSNISMATTPGWRNVMWARPQSPPPVVLPDRDFFGLFGPLTPRETPTASPDTELAWESRAASPQLTQPKPDVKEASSLPAHSLLLQAEHDASMFPSPPQSSSAKQAQLVPSSQYSPIGSRTPSSELSEDFKSYPTSPSRTVLSYSKGVDL